MYSKILASDQGAQFIAQFWRSFSEMTGVNLTSGYYPQNNGQTKRMNQELETGLHCLTSQSLSNWSKSSPWVGFAYNTLPSSSPGLRPFPTVLGYQPPFFQGLEKKVTVPSASAVICRCMWIRARQLLLKSSQAYKVSADYCPCLLSWSEGVAFLPGSPLTCPVP